ncbi:MAG TPA: hypothetical protein VIA08_03860 [Nitrososphaeraceae archaeon]|jgi:hypothetical protein
MTDTFDEIKGKAKNVAEKVTDKDTYTGNEDQSDYRSEGERGNKEPMNPEDIAEHEPTAVKRDKNQGSSGDPV